MTAASGSASGYPPEGKQLPPLVAPSRRANFQACPRTSTAAPTATTSRSSCRRSASLPPSCRVPVCGKMAERRISAGGGFVFKGSGFYITDYGKDGKKDCARTPPPRRPGPERVGEEGRERLVRRGRVQGRGRLVERRRLEGRQLEGRIVQGDAAKGESSRSESPKDRSSRATGRRATSRRPRRPRRRVRAPTSERTTR